VKFADNYRHLLHNGFMIKAGNKRNKGTRERGSDESRCLTAQGLEARSEQLEAVFTHPPMLAHPTPTHFRDPTPHAVL
jgi:hypothetical protein